MPATDAQTYAHKLSGPCKCGQQHGQAPATFAVNGNGKAHIAPPAVVKTTVYEVKDVRGQLWAEHIRYDLSDGDKRFAWRRNGQSGLDGLPVVDMPLYGSECLANAPAGATVYLCEGQKARDAVLKQGLLAVGTVTGAGGLPSDDVLGVLRGFRVVLWPDNDKDGAKHMQRIAARLAAMGIACYVLCWADAPDKGDAFEYFELGETPAMLAALVDAAPEWTPSERDSGAEDTTSAPPLPTLGIRTLASVQPETVRWLWPTRIPRGKLTIIAGDPGLGKSFLSLDIAARVSVGGVWPDGGRASQGDIILASGEDGVADTIRPRLDDLGADVRRIHTLDLTVSDPDDGQVGLDLRRHLDLIAQHVAERKAALLIVDPVLAFTGGVDTHRAAEVRAVLSPLAQMAEATGVAVLGIMHLNKRSGDSNALYRVSASLDFVAAARAAFLVARDPSNTKSALFVPIKANLAAPASALRFHFSLDGVLAWDGVAEDVDVAALLSPPVREDEGALGEAEDFLRELLADGPVAAASVLQEAKGAGIAEKTLRRAKEHLGVQAERETAGNKGQGRWRWFLPQDGHPQDGQTLSVEVGHLTKQIQTKAGVSVQIPQDGQHALTGHLTKQGDAAAWGEV